MHKGYIIGHITVNDPEAYQEYIVRDTPMIEAHGGRPIVRGGTSENVEGPDFARHVVFEFPDFESAKALYYSCLLYTSPSPRDQRGSRMPSSA